MNTDVALLECMLGGTRRIAAYAAASGRSGFFDVPQVRDAVLRNLEMLLEAGRQLSGSLRLRQPQIPWRAMAGLRIILGHECVHLDLDLVWRVVDRDLPPLQQQVSLLYEQLRSNAARETAAMTPPAPVRSGVDRVSGQEDGAVPHAQA